jgi:hypothetical protein
MAKRTIPQKDWIWYGNAGHLICGQWCRFHLTTKVGNYLVSTVGAYIHPQRSQGNEQTEAEWLKTNWPGEDIGFGRKYETMVFKAGDELDMCGYNTAGDAARGHLSLCVKWSKQ